MIREKDSGEPTKGSGSQLAIVVDYDGSMGLAVVPDPAEREIVKTSVMAREWRDAVEEVLLVIRYELQGEVGALPRYVRVE